ncbi:hypothetical protein VTL71DRAFT_6639 [Oculimacula yallundae]|uniref:Ankyrin n=1 Tax=Oculimacula yallundae TaxID=86028 RepID=A0ABR4BXK5_9HELO
MAKFHYLYDLPLDILKTLLDNVVETIGIAEAARLRLVCKLLDHEIPGALYRSPDFQVMNSWTSSDPRVVEEYILYRTLADGKRKPNLSARLHRVLEVVLPDLSFVDEQYQNALRTLVAAVADHGSGALRLMDCTKNSTLLDSTFRRDCLKAAARLGIPQLFDDIVADACQHNEMDNRNLYVQAFKESCLVHAAGGGQFQLVARILDARETIGYVKDSMEMGRVSRAAILGGHKDTVALLYGPKYRFTVGSPRDAVQVNRVDIYLLLCEHFQIPMNDVSHLVKAAEYGHVDFVKLCLANGTNPNINPLPELVSYRTESPLYRASSRGFRKIVQLLLAAGANPTDASECWQSLTGAARGGHHEIVADLLSAGAVPAHHGKWNPLVAACCNGQVRAAEVLLDSGIELWYKDRCLSIAAERGFESLVRLLVSRGAKIDANSSDSMSGFDTPMLEALKHGHKNVVEALLELGAKEVSLPQTTSATLGLPYREVW